MLNILILQLSFWYLMYQYFIFYINRLVNNLKKLKISRSIVWKVHEFNSYKI